MRHSSKSLQFLLFILPFITFSAGCEGDKIIVESPFNQVKGIQVSGSGSAFGDPDVAVLVLGVSVEKPSVKEARDEAASAMQKAIDFIKRSGVADKDIQTQQFSIQPQYVFIDRQQKLRGYLVTNTLSIKVRNIGKSGEIIDGVVEAGGDFARVQSITFTIDDPAKLQAQARVAAMKEAQDKAKTLAEQGGVKLGKPVSISENIGFVPQPTFFDQALARAEVATSIQPGQLKITVNVTVTYEID